MRTEYSHLTHFCGYPALYFWLRPIWYGVLMNLQLQRQENTCSPCVINYGIQQYIIIRLQVSFQTAIDVCIRMYISEEREDNQNILSRI